MLGNQQLGLNVSSNHIVVSCKTYIHIYFIPMGSVVKYTITHVISRTLDISPRERWTYHPRRLDISPRECWTYHPKKVGYITMSMLDISPLEG